MSQFDEDSSQDEIYDDEYENSSDIDEYFYRQAMNVYSSGGNFDPSLNISGSEFQSDAYLEYRQRVLDQLAAECNEKTTPDKVAKVEEPQQATQKSPVVKPKDDTTFLHSSNYDQDVDELASKTNADAQPSWDDSDLQLNTYKVGLKSSCSSLPRRKEKTATSEAPKSDDVFLSDDARRAKSLTTWSSFDEHIEKASLSRLDSTKATSFDSYQGLNSSASPLSPNSSRRLKKNTLQRRKHDLKEDSESSRRPSYPSRTDRQYSTSNQSLKICYINNRSSSEEEEEENEEHEGEESEKVSLKSSSTSSPFSSPNGYGQRYLRRKRYSDHSISSAASSSDKTIISTMNQHTTGISNVKNGLQDELEMETRYKLAQAHQKAKLQAEEERKKNKFSSIALKILKVTLPEETNEKLTNYSLTKTDCLSLRLGQLQLILNDMQSKKQALSNELVELLLARDQFKTENEAKVVDIDDIKAILEAVGPETSV